MTVGEEDLHDSPKQHQRPRSSTRDSDQKLPHLPMLEDETHELPLPRRIHPTPNPTTIRKRSQHQHPGGSDQEILRHTIQCQESRPIEGSQGCKDLPFKWNSKRDDKSAKDTVIRHSKRIAETSRQTSR